jgi:hypothetical protein
MVLFVGYFGPRIVYIASLFKRYPASLAKELEARQVRISDSVEGLQQKFAASASFAWDLNNERYAERIIRMSNRNLHDTKIPGIIKDLQNWAAKDPGTPGELVGLVDADLFGEGFDLIYHFSESALCDKSVLGRQTDDKLSDKSGNKGQLLALAKVYPYLFDVYKQNDRTKWDIHTNVLRHGAEASGFRERTLLRGPAPN